MRGGKRGRLGCGRRSPLMLCSEGWELGWGSGMEMVLCEYFIMICYH